MFQDAVSVEQMLRKVTLSKQIYNQFLALDKKHLETDRQPKPRRVIGAILGTSNMTSTAFVWPCLKPRFKIRHQISGLERRTGGRQAETAASKRVAKSGSCDQRHGGPLVTWVQKVVQ